jgi:hypothetical protein
MVVICGQALGSPSASTASGAEGQATELAHLTASDGAAGDTFGSSVAISGDTAVVGSFVNESAYVYVRSGTAWVQQAQLTASDGKAGDEFGYSVAVSGDTVVVGATLADVGTNADQGAVYVFTRSGSTWTQQAKLMSPDGSVDDEFGTSVAVDGDTLLVGVIYDNIGYRADQGSAFVFTRSGTAWAQQTKLTASDGEANDDFGVSVALSGGTALVGAFGDDIGSHSWQGSAYVFVRSGATWSQQADLTADDGATLDKFGRAAALSGDTALVGAPWHAVAGHADQGAAYAFVRSGQTWSQQAELTASGGAAGDALAFSVALAGDTALVGAPLADGGAGADQGTAYVFDRSGATWSEDARLTASDGSAPDQFGNAVSLSGQTGLVGASRDNVAANIDQGSAYVVDVDVVPPVTEAVFQPAMNAAGWASRPVTLTLSASDAGGVGQTYYRVGTAGDFTVYDPSAKPVISSEGRSTVQYYSSDVKGQVEATRSADVGVDGTRPTTTAFAATVRKGKKVKLGFMVSDAMPGSGQATVTLKILKGRRAVKTLAVSGARPVNARQTHSWRCKLGRGTYTVKVYAVDLAGNVQSKVGSAKLKVR